MSHWILSAQEAAAAVGGRLTVINADPQSIAFSGVGTDTRVDLLGQLFVALKGENHDAHDHLDDAVKNGARGLLIHRPLSPSQKLAWSESGSSGVAVIEVADTLIALQKLGLYWRRKNRALVLGITGTNGKTSTKEFLAAILSSRLSVHASKGSYNNHWGVPLTLLGIRPDHDVAVVEMGMNHLGELKELSALVEADAVVCTMVGRGHLEGVGSIEGVASAKSEIYEFAKPSAAFVFNSDNPHTLKMAERFASSGRKTVLFSESKDQVQLGEQILGVEVKLAVTGSGPRSIQVSGRIGESLQQMEVPVFGRHNVTNLMAASALALVAGLHGDEIFRALSRCRNAWGRSEWRDLSHGARMLFDAYNANPESMKAALENIASLRRSLPRGQAHEQTARVFAVLGDMRELGEHSAKCHEELGRIAGQCKFDGLLFFGKEFSHFERGLKAIDPAVRVEGHREFQRQAWLKLRDDLKPGDIVLVKASRGVGLERVLD